MGKYDYIIMKSVLGEEEREDHLLWAMGKGPRFYKKGDRVDCQKMTRNVYKSRSFKHLLFYFDEWIKHLWYVYAVEYYLVVKIRKFYPL